jgi:competence protein ComEC
VPWPSGVAGGIELAAVVVIAVRLCRRARPRALCAVAAGLALVIQIPVRSVTSGWPPTGWLVVACDVGQGDAVALNSGPGQAVLIDAGPEPVAVDRCLRALGIRHIPLLVVTHAHLDHVGGLSGALHDRQVDRVLTSPLRDPMGGYRLESAVLGSRGLVAGSVVSGTAVDVGAVHLDFLGPRHVFAGTRSDPNNSSVIVRATLHGRRVLLAADAEVDAQDDLLAAGVDLRADILKVPHHGSAYSDPSFLQATHAALGLVSVGAGNDYGLPSPLLIAELGRLAMVTRRTDQDGDIAVVDGGKGLTTVVRSTTNGNATRSTDGSPDGTKRPAQAARAPPAAARLDAYLH